MEIVKASQRDVISHAVNILKRGGVLVIPTETAYGLAGDATNSRAIKKIYKIKGRDFKKFLPLIVSGFSQMKRFFVCTDKELDLYKKYDGLAMVVAPKKQKVKDMNVCLLPTQDSCVVRVSTNQVARSLARRLGKPIIATSANVSQGENCYSIDEVVGQLAERGDRPDLVLDGGKLKQRKPSTIVKVEGREIKIIRQGEIKIS